MAPGSPGTTGASRSPSGLRLTPRRPSTSSSRNASRRREPRRARPRPRASGWIWLVADGPTLPGAAITPVTLSDGQSFTWANLDADRHYRVIEVGTASPPATGTGSAPAGWAVTGFACESVGATLLESDDNYIVGYLSTIDGEGVTSPRLVRPAPSPTACSQKPRAGSTITAHKVGDRSAIRSNQPLQGATMGLWRDLNGDGNFQPGGADGAAFTTCVTAGNWSVRLHRIWPRVATGSRRCLRPPVGPGMPSSTGVRARAQRRTLPCRTRPSGMETPPQPSASPVQTYTNGFPIIVDGRPSDVRSTDDFANRRTNPSIGDVTCEALLPHRPRPRPVRIDPEQRPAAYENAVLASSTTSWARTPRSGSCPSRRAPRSRRATSTSWAAHPPRCSRRHRQTSTTTWAAAPTGMPGCSRSMAPFTPAPDLVVMVTDGNPTLNNTTEHLRIRGELGRLHAGRHLVEPAQEQRLSGHHRGCRSERAPSRSPASSASAAR